MRLSERDNNIITAVTRFHQLASGHIQRLYFADGSAPSRGIRTRRTLRRLAAGKKLRRIERSIGGFGGSEGFTYLAPGNTARAQNLHALDVSELYVRLVEAAREGLLALEAFDPEPGCYLWVNSIQLKPDAFIAIDGQDFYLELDRGTEPGMALADKVKRYSLGARYWEAATPFPRVILVVPDEQRVRQALRYLTRDVDRELFDVVLFDRAVETFASYKPSYASVYTSVAPTDHVTPGQTP